jgi:hypothetical protein
LHANYNNFKIYALTKYLTNTTLKGPNINDEYIKNSNIKLIIISLVSAGYFIVQKWIMTGMEFSHK